MFTSRAALRLACICGPAFMAKAFVVFDDQGDIFEPLQRATRDADKGFGGSASSSYGAPGGGFAMEEGARLAVVTDIPQQASKLR